jgi:hypothetical protein
MQITSTGPQPAHAIMPKVPESVEGPGPDHDGDADDKSVAANSPTAPGVGKAVDTKA